MKTRMLMLMLPLLLACGAGDEDSTAALDGESPAVAVATSAGDPEPIAANEVAVFSVKDLDMGFAGALATALGELPGVLAARPDLDAGHLAVEFSHGDATPGAILDAMVGAGADAALLEVVPAAAGEDAKSGCTGCPSQSQCQGG